VAWAGIELLSVLGCHGAWWDIHRKLPTCVQVTWGFGLHTEHAKSLVTIVKETSDVDQKSTMLQLVDLWRSRARQPGISLYHNKLQLKEHASRWYILVLEEVIVYTLCLAVSYCGLHNMYSWQGQCVIDVLSVMWEGGDAWLAKDLSKEDVERVIIQLILDGILVTYLCELRSRD